MELNRSYRVEPRRLCLPAILPKVPFHINYRPCFCGKELIVETIPINRNYQFTNYYPTNSCLSDNNPHRQDQCSVYSTEYFRQFFPENLNTVQPYALPEYPSYPEVQFKSFNNKPSRRNNSKFPKTQKRTAKKKPAPSKSTDNLDR